MLENVTEATTQGPRPSQEDRWVTAEVGDRLLVAVMDGHGGAEASTLCAERLEGEVVRFLDGGHPPVETLRSAAAALEEATHETPAGTSLTAVLLEDEEAAIAVLGDSPVVWRDASGGIHVGPVHNAQIDEAGRDAAVERGAEYLGGYLVEPVSGEGVALTRVLGDAGLPFMERTPEVYRVTLGPESFVVCATDGVFTSAAPNPVAYRDRVAELIDGGADARALVDDALDAGTDDNVTVVLWRAGD